MKPSKTLDSSSGGEFERRITTKAPMETTRSVEEWTASERTLAEPVSTPATGFTASGRAFEEV